MRSLMPIFLASVVQFANAAPVVHDVEGARVIISRPVDSWSGHKVAADYLLNCVGTSKLYYFYIDEAGKKRSATGGLWSKKEDNELTRSVDALLAKSGYTVEGADGGCSVTVERPVTISTDEIAPFLKTQNSLYRTYVLSQGDPSTLTGRVTVNRYIGAVFSFAAMGVGIDRLSQLGSGGTAFAVSLGQDISLLSAPSRRGLVPLPLENIDLSGFKTLDVRTVQSAAGDRIGQIVIAYPEARDATLEAKALAFGIVAAAGGFTNKQEVEAARIADHQKRVSLWTECVASAQCK